MLTKEQKEQFDRDGYLIIPNFFDPEPLVKRAQELVAQFNPTEHQLTKFTTSDDNHIGNKYFLESGDKIRYFLEDSSTVHINKIGHALHALDPVFKDFSTSEKVKDIAKSFNYRDCRILQSMLILKQARVGGLVPPHIDSTFLYTDPPSAMGLWFALQDCTETNGCMSFCPGSHKRYPITKRFVRSGTSTTMITRETHSEPKEEEYVLAPVQAGSLVLIHGLVYHKSGLNKSDMNRWIYTFHMIEGEYPYAKDNWLQPTESIPFTKLD